MTKLNKKIDELHSKLMAKTDDLNDVLKSKAEVRTPRGCVMLQHCRHPVFLQLSAQIVDSTRELKNKDDKIGGLNTQ